MTVPGPSNPVWPEGETGRVLLNCIINASVDVVFEHLFGVGSALQARLHKLRNDTNCAESPWVPSPQQLPAQQFSWPAPAPSASMGAPAAGQCRKVRFEAAASLASKAFSSEEVQSVTLHAPGSHYVLLTEVATTALYGDQFSVITRYGLSAKGPNRTHLHVAYAVAFRPSLSRLMRPMVAKGVDGGIRGSFAVLKKLLQDEHGLLDLPEATPSPAPLGAAGAAGAAPAPAAPPAAAAAGAPAAALAAQQQAGPLTALADYVVYQELVSRILQLSDPRRVAKALAVCLTLALIHVLIALLRPLADACAAASSSGGGLQRSLCWPLALLSVPDSLGEVLGALLLVALANKLLLLGVSLTSAAMSTPVPSRASSQRLPSMSIGSTLAAAVGASPASGPDSKGAAAAAAGAQQAAANGGSSTSGTNGNGSAQQVSPGRRGGVRTPTPGAAAMGGQADGLAALSNLGSVMTEWGRNLLGAGVVDSISNSEGLKAFVSGSWSKGPAEAARAAPASTGSASSSSDARQGSSGGGGRSHRHTSSFTAVMDPLGLNIIEDYAMQGEQGAQAGAAAAAAAAGGKQLPRLTEERVSSASPGASAAAGASRKASSKSEPHSLSRSPSPDKGMRRARSSGSAKGDGGDVGSLEDAQDLRQPLLAARADSSSSSSSGPGSSPEAEGVTGAAGSQRTAGQPRRQPARAGSAGSGSSRSTTPAGSSASHAGTPMPSSAIKQQQQGSGSRAVRAVSFGADAQGAGLGPGAGQPPMTSSRSASPLAVRSSALPALARHSASPVVYGGLQGSGGSSSHQLRGSSGASPHSPGYELLAGAGSGEVLPSAVEPGMEEEDEVDAEVFEHERMQPFRGFGHTWPGHFLPSDRVGHWGDRSGAPGGAVSMLFDRVAPKLPRGWAWADPEWRVDMTGHEEEGCDSEGWAYGMDFTWITWPPAPLMGRPSMKTFVRRRRWVRTRVRLPPGSAAATAAAGDATPQQSPVFVLPPGAAPANTAAGPFGGMGSDGGLMGSLGGLVGPDSASAAAAAASAMASRFMKLVQDLPLSPMNSGPEAGSSPKSPRSADSSAAAPPAGWSTQQHAQGRAAPGGTDGGGSGGGKRPPSRLGAAAASVAAAARSVLVAEDQHSGSSDDDDGDDSSSVDSIDAPPPRPRLSEALAHLQDEQSSSTAAGEAPKAVRPAAAPPASGAGAISPAAAEAGLAAERARVPASAPAARPLQAGSKPADGATSAHVTDATSSGSSSSRGAPAAAPSSAEEPPQPAAASMPAAPVSDVAVADEAPAASLLTKQLAQQQQQQQQQQQRATVQSSAPEPPPESDGAVAAPAPPAAPAAAVRAGDDARAQPAPAEEALGSGDWTWSAAAQPAPGAGPGPATAGAAPPAAASTNTDQASAAVPRTTADLLVAPASSSSSSTAANGGSSSAQAAAATAEAAPVVLPCATISDVPTVSLAAGSSLHHRRRSGSGGGTPRALRHTSSGGRGGRGKLGAVPLRQRREGGSASSAGGLGGSGSGNGADSAAGAGGVLAGPSRPPGDRATAPAAAASAASAPAPTLQPEAQAPASTPAAPAPAPAVDTAGAPPASQPAAGVASVSADELCSGQGWVMSPEKQKRREA